jgi:hypothetical protein
MRMSLMSLILGLRESMNKFCYFWFYQIMNIISFDIGTKNFAYSVITSENELNFKLINLEGRIKNVDSLVIGRSQVLT